MAAVARAWRELRYNDQPTTALAVSDMASKIAEQHLGEEYTRRVMECRGYEEV